MSGRPAAGAGPATTASRVRLVLREAGFRRLLSTRFVSQFGDGLFQVAAADVLVFRNPTDNPAWDVTKLAVAVLIPFSLLVPFLGVFIDRWDRRRILVVVPVVRAAMAAALPLATRDDPRSAWVYAIVLLVLSGNRFLLATISAVTPQLVPRDELIVANSVATTGGSILTLVGWGVGAAVAELSGPNWTAGVSVGAFALTAFLGAAVPVRRAREPVRERLFEAIGAVARELAGGIRKVRSEPLVAYALSSIVFMQLLIGSVVAASVVTFIERFDAGVGSYSILLAATAFGVFVGIVTVPSAERRVAKERLIPVAFAAAGAAALASAPSLSRFGIMGATFVIGLSFAYAKIPVDTIVQEQIPDAFRGRAFAAYDVMYNVARVVGSLAAAAAIQLAVSDKAVIGGTGAGAIAVAVLLRGWATRARRAERIRPRVLLPAGEMVTVRAYAGSRAEEEPRAILVGGHEVPIEAVEWRAVEERGGERRRIFVVRTGDLRVRLAYSEASSSWTVDRILRS